PLTVIDELGADTVVAGLEALYATTGDPVHEPASILRSWVAAEVADDSHASYPGARQIDHVGVIGSGTMATGIMEVFAKAGYTVTFVARGEEKAARVIAAITKSLDKQVEKGRLTGDQREDVLDRVIAGTELAALGDVDLVVEAIAEDLDIKKQTFATLDKVCKPGAVLATTTSSLPVAEIGAVTSRPQDVIGMHFFNPATVMKLVEVVTTPHTAVDVETTVLEVTANVGQTSVRGADRAGFIVNALLFPYLNDAVKLLQDGVAGRDEIDAAIKEGCGYPMGPFALLDVVGNDVSLAIEKVVFEEFGHANWAPAPLLEQTVADGRLGRKTGAGFYDY
ncbi:3-hydroxyacyl-CoA dehydrogenase NAD-binding domain-containing protein, partial [Jatrophihabitans sp.]|uniref:3-hydroxyacyl-CoA dehydrogenase family protein n=1 Tax=Jatrophihabitans sp. TaxID=1932789 RepID=UPI0030C72179|nr:3-hydroxyacyl-CoA dehydrogenase [Jatrophihabitans sp.]